MPVHAKQSAEFMAELPLPKFQFLKCHRADYDQIFPNLLRFWVPHQSEKEF